MRFNVSPSRRPNKLPGDCVLSSIVIVLSMLSQRTNELHHYNWKIALDMMRCCRVPTVRNPMVSEFEPQLFLASLNPAKFHLCVVGWHQGAFVTRPAVL